MSYGLPYDSEAGRTVAGLVTALMHAEANLTSSELAAVVGPFPVYRENAASMLGVMRMHHDQLGRFEPIDPTEPAFTRLLRARVREAWDGVLAAGERSGFRNSQTTLLAPTGTI